MNPDTPDPHLSESRRQSVLAILSAILTYAIFLLLLPFPRPLFAETPAPTGTTAPSEATENYQTLSDFIEKSLGAETENLQKLRESLLQTESFDKQLSQQISSHEIMVSAHSNLLLMPDVTLEALEKAKAENSEALATVTSDLETIASDIEAASRQQTQTDEQYELNRNQMADIRKKLPDSPFRTQLTHNLAQLLQLIIQKREVLKKKLGLNRQYQLALGNISRKLSESSEKLAVSVTEYRQESLFKRDKGVNHPWFGLNQFIQEISDIRSKIRLSLSEDLQNLKNRIDQQGIAPVLAFFVLLISVGLLAWRLRRHLLKSMRRAETAPFWQISGWIFAAPLRVCVIGLFIYIYAHIRNFFAVFGIFRPICHFCTLWLCTQWALEVLKQLSCLTEQRLSLSAETSIRRLLYLIRIVTIPMVLFVWLFGVNSHAVASARLFFEISLFFWCIAFWHALLSKPPEECPLLCGSYLRRNVLIAVSYGIVVIGLVMQCVGFGSLSVHWYVSWGLTAIFLMWLWLFHKMLGEWTEYIKKRESVPAGDGEKNTGNAVNWFWVQIARLMWLQAGIFLLLFAWYPDKIDIFNAYLNLVQAPVSIGGLEFSILTVFSMIAALMLTHAAVSLWKSFLNRRLLADSRMEAGRANSVTMISGYLLWGAGILIALSIIGVKGESLAVAFGGLGIGLGFGLQSILNNFVSGLILLLERPVQVGDMVDIDGITGEVREINVRSTLVQTYDNATLVIPNSQLISNTLTNWSFKDARIRRNIYVGVAYGTDADRVMETLLDIANTTELVYRFPKTMIYFHDFGDSALIFRVRFWTHFDYCIEADSKVRSEIYRRFRELGIEITFPNLNLHLQSIAPEILNRAAGTASPMAEASGGDVPLAPKTPLS